MHHDTELRVRYAETDQMGIVYHGNYFPWFEEARTNLLVAAGYTYRDLEQKGLFFPLIECSCRFRQPAKYFDELVVRASVEQVRGAQFSIVYQGIRKEDHMLLAEGRTAHAFVGRDFRPVNMLRYMPEVYEKLKEMARPEEE